MQRILYQLKSRMAVGGFIGDERGFVTHFALTVLILILLFSGLSLDSANSWRVRDMLQTAADAAARAGAMDLPNEATAMDSVLELAGDNLTAANKKAISASSVEFGTWDNTARSFTPLDTPANAVRVTASRSKATNNAVPTFLLRLVGLTSWDVNVESVAWRSTESCSVADISSNGKVTIKSENDFYNGYCVEGAKQVKFTGDNQFDNNNSIYVTDLNKLNLPDTTSLSSIVGRGTSKSSSGLTYGDIAKVRTPISAAYEADIPALAAKYLDPLSAIQPSYINGNSAVIKLDAKNVKYTSFAPGRVYEVQCGDGKGNKAQFFKEQDVSKVVIVSNCAISLGKESSFEDVVLVSKGAGSGSVYAAKEVVLGKDDECKAGGGVSIYAAGDVTSGKKLKLYGVVISAGGKVKLKNASNKIAGLTIAAKGDVKLDGKASFGTCKTAASSDGNVAYLLVK
ncbi:MAG: hypothetical protein GXP05_11620 [Alphaproteobacteria bacterium]|nr:hypothetical protein [Alphaproteobacteria bacterium]